MRIEVGDPDITDAVPGFCHYRSPICLAAQRAGLLRPVLLEDPWRLCWAIWANPPVRQGNRYPKAPLPSEAVAFIEDWIAGYPVEPLGFDVEYREIIDFEE